jgi:hypothetical protein
MKVLQRFQPWQIILLRYTLPNRRTPAQLVATIPSMKGETGIEAVEAEVEGSKEAKEGALALRTRGDSRRKVIWAAASGSRQSGCPISCITN